MLDLDAIEPLPKFEFQYNGNKHEVDIAEAIFRGQHLQPNTDLKEAAKILLGIDIDDSYKAFVLLTSLSAFIDQYAEKLKKDLNLELSLPTITGFQESH